jgi:hypothetical protein
VIISRRGASGCRDVSVFEELEYGTALQIRDQAIDVTNRSIEETSGGSSGAAVRLARGMSLRRGQAPAVSL